MATSSEAGTRAPARLPSKLAIPLAMALIPVLAGALFYWDRWNGSSSPQGGYVQVSSTQQPSKPIFVALDPITVNLQSEGKPKFLHLGVSLKLADEQARGRVMEVLPELRSRLLLLLSNRNPDDLTRPEDKSALAEEITGALNKPLRAASPPYAIDGVAFNAFVVQ